jgi:hypothetical protein
MFGSVSEWFYKVLAGIAPHPDAVGFDRIVVRPHVVGDLSWVRGRYESVRGTVASEWKVEDDVFSLTVDVPVGATATVYVPVPDTAHVHEGGRAARESPGITYLRHDDGAALYQVESGRYEFVSEGFRREPAGTPLKDPPLVSEGLSMRVSNPAVDGLRVTFSLPAAAPAKLSVYDISGRVMLAQRFDRPGSQTVELGTIAPGVYIVRLSQAGRSVTRRVAVIR